MEELRYSAATNYPTPEKARQFWARNVCAVREAAPTPQLPQTGLSRAYSADGFTLVHSALKTKRVANGFSIRPQDEIIADGMDRFVLVLQLDYKRYLTQFGRRLSVNPGCFAFFCTGEPYAMELSPGQDSFEEISLALPRHFVVNRIVDCERYCAHAGIETMRLKGILCSTLIAFGRDAWAYDREEFYRTAQIIGDLLLLGLDTGVDPLSTERSVRCGTIIHIKQVIRQCMTDPELTLTDIARKAGISLSHLHKLFHDESQTAYEFLKTERLRYARELLLSASMRDASISQISWKSGFSDLSFFSRCFKQAFGISPRGMRAMPPCAPRRRVAARDRRHQ